MALGQPMDYRLSKFDPMTSVLQGMKTGMAVTQLQEQQAAKEKAAAQQKELYALMNNPEATEVDYRKMVALMPKEYERMECS